MSNEERHQYRDFAEEGRLRAEEERSITATIGSEQLSRLGASIGMVNFEQAAANIRELMIRADRAFELGCYVETISLRLQHMEFWLRIFWIARNGSGKSLRQAGVRSDKSSLTVKNADSTPSWCA